MSSPASATACHASTQLEVLYDLDVAAQDEATAAGLRYHRIQMPNTQGRFIAALAAVVQRTEVLTPA
ncbi:MAG: hypothetical protein NVS9B6_15620 [Candidatus Limnocylindrales bacterium]